jgi:hypothetical protein
MMNPQAAQTAAGDRTDLDEKAALAPLVGGSPSSAPIDDETVLT